MTKQKEKEIKPKQSPKVRNIKNISMTRQKEKEIKIKTIAKGQE
jgi:hypothetical protein